MTSRITDSLTGVGLAALLAVVGVGTERVYGDPLEVRTIAGLEQRVSRLESIVQDGTGIHVEGGRAEVHVTVPPEKTEAELHHQRVQQEAYARRLAMYGKEIADVMLHASGEDREGSVGGHAN